MSEASRSGLQALRALRTQLPDPSAPLRALEPIRQLSAQIRLEHRIAESLQAVPVQAGPLNSQGVVVRTLNRLQQTSPAYLAALVRQMDTWATLQALMEAAPEAARQASGKRPGPRAPRPRGP